ncbi:MAG: hypothetical protein R3F43_13410 [bacterium]
MTVFEKADRAGGLLRYGIPDFQAGEGRHRSPASRQLVAEGIEFRLGVAVGTDAWTTLRAEHDAVVLAIGAERPRPLDAPGAERAGVHLGDAVPDGPEPPQRRGRGGRRRRRPGPPRGDPGGGDTGADCLGTALRQGRRR